MEPLRQAIIVFSGWCVGYCRERFVTKRHSAAREMFSLHYIKPMEIPEKFKDDFGILFERRQIADYDIDGEFPLDEIIHLIGISEDFLAFVKQKYA